jgi:hypothetical protein
MKIRKASSYRFMPPARTWGEKPKESTPSAEVAA